MVQLKGPWVTKPLIPFTYGVNWNGAPFLASCFPRDEISSVICASSRRSDKWSRELELSNEQPQFDSFESLQTMISTSKDDMDTLPIFSPYLGEITFFGVSPLCSPPRINRTVNTVLAHSPIWWSGFWIRSSNATQCSSNHAFGHSIKEYLRNWLLPLPGSALRRQFEFRRVRVRMGLATIHDKLLDFWIKSVSYTQMFSHIIYNKSEILHWRLIILTYFSYLHRWWFTISVNQNKM